MIRYGRSGRQPEARPEAADRARASRRRGRHITVTVALGAGAQRARLSLTVKRAMTGAVRNRILRANEAQGSEENLRENHDTLSLSDEYHRRPRPRRLPGDSPVSQTGRSDCWCPCPS
jgi:hypothetical protein